MASHGDVLLARHAILSNVGKERVTKYICLEGLRHGKLSLTSLVEPKTVRYTKGWFTVDEAFRIGDESATFWYRIRLAVYTQ